MRAAPSSRQVADEQELVHALAQARAALDGHAARLAQALAELGAIDLPDGPAPAVHAELLEPLGPFYLAYQLDFTGLLSTAESIAGLYASGAIEAPLGSSVHSILEFWRERRNRLTAAERKELFTRVFEQPYFDRLLRALAQDLVRHADNAGQPDWQEAVALEQSARQLISFVEDRAGGMTAYAASEIIGAINTALRFMRDRALQAAFNVRDLWSLVKVAAGDPNASGMPIQNHVDLGKSGSSLLAWLARAARTGALRIDPAAPEFTKLMTAAQRWILADKAAGPAPPGSVQTAHITV